ncbi:DUF6049 family protein [Nocardioides zeae]|uniref:Uncharacterized protein n=1 Tax=Nocardioides zeae TaxID=1457234 RepID=A0AAJ1U2E5_9ACTN|nr:DUF6049 family protein [Nocardioides zeae]MDQ1106109.1 hypothetical protein [Nocardioides zeae]
MLDRDASPLRATTSPRLAALLLVLAVLLGPLSTLVAGPAGAVGPAAGPALADEETGTPLTVTIDGVTPDVGVLAPGTVVTVTGTVTNASDETWTDLQIFPVTSSAPLTTEAELEAAADSDPLSFIGERLLVDGLFDESVTRLAPGETRPYRLDLPIEQLQISGAPGVYWLGVHALGADGDGTRSGNAVGRARTFLPLLDRGRAADTAGRASVVVPLRAPVRYAADGSIADPEAWAVQLGDGGRLRRIADVIDPDSGAGPTSILLDPALLDVARRLAEGNPARSLAPTSDPEEEPEEEPDDPGSTGTDATEEPSDDATDPGSVGGDTGDLQVADGPLAAAAASWLEDVLAAATAGDLLVLPYGDVDLGAAALHDPVAYGRARLLADDALDRYGLEGTPAVAPRGEGLPTGVVDALEDDVVVLVGDGELGADAPEGLSAAAPHAEADGRQVVVVDDAVAEGGPAPGDRTSGVLLRQRLAATMVAGALADEEGATQERAVLLPALWNPGDAGTPTRGLTTGWLRSVPLTDLATAVDAEPVATGLADLATEVDPAQALPDDLFVLSRSLVTRGSRLDSILPETDAVRSQTERAAAAVLSYEHRGDLARVRSGVRDQIEQVQGLLASVTVEAPPTITLSGDDGDFNVRVVNGLDQPVVVELRGDESRRVTVAPSGPVEVPAGGSASVRMTVTMHRLGVYDVDVRVVDETGTALGGAVAVPVRSAAVSDIIWAIIIGATVLLVGATLWWYRGRPRRRISTPASVAAVSRPDDDADAQADAQADPQAPAPPPHGPTGSEEHA